MNNPTTERDSPGSLCESLSPHVWISEFEKKHGRKPRVLHIGNIANNAYNNAKILNQAGIESHVLCYDYYHVMGYPEWEEADFEGSVGDLCSPEWNRVTMKDFKRPRWFAQGPFEYCIRYLKALNENHAFQQLLWWNVLQGYSGFGGMASAFIIHILNIMEYLEQALHKPDSILNRIWAKRVRWFPLGALAVFTIFTLLAPLMVLYYLAASLVMIPFKIIKKLILKISAASSSSFSSFFKRRTEELVQTFASLFPDRPDKLTSEDIEPYKSLVAPLTDLFKKYDVIHAYATDGIFPMIADVPYVAYEHGTIRSVPFDDTPIGRLCALVYRAAPHVIITNADDIDAAKKLKIERYTFVPHPINEEFSGDIEESKRLREELHTRTASDFIVFHPARHHWSDERNPNWEKKNDTFIIGFAKFVKEVNPSGAAIFVNWGYKLAESRELLEKLGVADRVLWIEPVPHRKMIRYIMATDLLADQFWVGSFGSTMPKALAFGAPAMQYFNEEIHRWCLPEMPPLINTKTSDDVAEGLRRIYMDNEWRQELIIKGREWYRRYHSNEVIVSLLSSIYKRLI